MISIGKLLGIGDDTVGLHIYNVLNEEEVNIEKLRIKEGYNAYAKVKLIGGERTFVSGDKGVSEDIRIIDI